MRFDAVDRNLRPNLIDDLFGQAAAFILPARMGDDAERSAGLRYFNTVAGWKPVPEKGMIVRTLQKAKELEAGT